MRRFAALTLALSVLAAAAGAHSDALAQSAPLTYTDAQVRAYVAANEEIEPISEQVAEMTPEQRLQATTRIRAILQRHGLTGDEYAAIDAQAGANPGLAERIAAVRVEDLNDDTLRRFVAAAREIDPISRSLAAEATAAERAQAASQIRAVLNRNGISAAIYNAIAARAQGDEALAARIAALQAPAQPDASSSAP